MKRMNLFGVHTDTACILFHNISLLFFRLFNLSIFEICSERGKGEKAYDLLGGESSELSVQQSTIRGLKEVCECFLG